MTIKTEIRTGTEGQTILLEEQGYRVARNLHGVAVYGSIPVSDFGALAKVWTEEGHDFLDFGVASALGATFAATSKEGGLAWRAMIESTLAGRYPRDPEKRWLYGTDTGTSALTIFECLAESSFLRTLARVRLGGGGGSTPNDPDDLGRCIRLLDRFPAWLERLGEVADPYPAWVPFVAYWPELESLYREECPEHHGVAPKTHARMREISGAK